MTVRSQSNSNHNGSRRLLKLGASLFACAMIGAMSVGCAQKQMMRSPSPVIQVAHFSGLGAARFQDSIRVEVRPPIGWKERVASADRRHEHRLWESPDDTTAFGVIHFRLPWPVGHDLAFDYGFLKQMRRIDGEPKSVQKFWDDESECLRVDVEGQAFHIRGRFFVRGLRAWMVYAGTRQNQPVNQAYFELAARAEELAIIEPELSEPVEHDYKPKRGKSELARH